MQAGLATGIGLWAGSALGCGGSQETKGEPTPSNQPKQGGTVTVRADADARGFDPHLETQTQASIHITKIYSGLMIWNRDSTELVPDLAQSYEQPDEVTYIFKLNQGVKWHNIPPVNGRELTAEDVKFSIERMSTNQPGKFQHAYYFLGRIAKIDAVDKYTVRFTMNKPYAPFMAYIGSPWSKIVAREAVDKWGELTKSETMIGTGGFMLKSHTPNVELVVKRNPDYFKKGLPYLDEHVTRFIADPSTVTTMLLGGELDYATIDSVDIERVKKAKPDYQIIEGVSTNPFIFRTPPYDDKIPQKAPFDNKKVRQAILRAINKQEYIDVVYGGRGVQCVGMIAPDRQPWALPESDQIKQDIPKAKQLMAEAGFPNGFKTDIICPNMWYTVDCSQVAKGQLAKIGIDAEIKPIEVAQYYNVVYAYNYNLNMHNMTGSEEPTDYLAPYYGSAATFYRWGNKELQQKIAEQEGIVLDKEKRIKAIQEIEHMIQDEAPMAPLFVVKYSTFGKPSLRNFLPVWNNYQGYYATELWLSE
jgi:peptide/nickel transport system substrate-binding protein